MKRYCAVLLLLAAVPSSSSAVAAATTSDPTVDSTSDSAVGPPTSAAAAKAKKTKHKSKKAASTTPESVQPIPDGDTCGLGWKVTDKRTLSAVITRGTTNVFVPPTFGMTSGTIGCKQIPLSKREQSGLEYAYNNRDELTLEIAEGDGEFLRGFAESMGCGGAYPVFAHELQSHFREVTRDGRATGIQLFNAVRNELRNDPRLVASCGLDGVV